MGKLGIKAKVYRNTATYNSPTWSEVNIISDLAVNPTWDQGEANARSSRVKKNLKTMLGLEFTGKLKKTPGNANYEAFMNALVSDNVLDLLILDGDNTTVNNRGWRLDVQVFSGNEDQAMGNVLYEDITLMPADTDNEPKAALVGSGPALTYSIPGEAGATFV